MNFKAAIFDLDGLLIDSEPLYQQAWATSASEQSFELSATYYFDNLSGRNIDDYLPELAKLYGSQFDSVKFRRRCIEIVARLDFANQVQVKPGVRNMLTWLKKQSVPCVVATGSNQSHAQRCLATTGLSEFFSFVVSRDQVAQGKPDPALYLKALAILGHVPSAIVAFEDSDSGVKAAVAAKISTIMIPDRKPANLVSINSAVSIVRDMFEARKLPFFSE